MKTPCPLGCPVPPEPRPGHVEGYRLLACPRCGLGFCDPLAHPGGDWYEASDLYEDRSATPPSLPVPRGDWRHATFLRTCPSPGRVLDVGCGDGGFLALAAEHGWDPSGLDLDRRAVRLARDVRRLDGVQRGPAPEAVEDFPPGDFDAVTAFDFLEHSPEPVRLARAMRERLRPGGVFFVTVPRLDRWPRLYDPEADLPPHHLTMWTVRSAERLLAEAGFAEFRVIPKPLDGKDFYMHWRWRENRLLGCADTRKPWHYLVYPVLAAAAALLRLSGRGRGHTLALVGRA